MSLFQEFFNMSFADVYTDSETFKTEYSALGFPTIMSNESMNLIYLLLLGRYANSTIANSDINQFKVQLFSKIWQYGGTWSKRVEIQEKLRSLSLEDGSEIYTGGKAIYNTALNPGTAPSTNDLEELNFINSQNTTNYKKSKLEGLALLNDLLETDVTAQFIDRFQDLFVKIAIGTTKYYTTIEEEN